MLNWPFQLSKATGAFCSLSDTVCCCAGCTWLHPSDIRRSGKRRAVMGSDKRGGGGSLRERQGNSEFGTRQRLGDSQRLVTAFSCCCPLGHFMYMTYALPWHLWLAVWVHCDISLRTLVACQTPASGLTNAPGTACCRLTFHMLAKESNRLPNYCFRRSVKCNFLTFSQKLKLMLKCMNASKNAMDRVTGTPD